jgi:Fur family ferric uptake transcriptional regulator
LATELADLLRQHGVQVTVQRIAVLRVVSSQPHITADGVAEVVRAELGVISKQAVYDAVGILVERGLIRRMHAGSPARYEDRVGDNHHHLVCRSCNHMVDINCAVGFTPCLSPSESMGYEIDEAEVIYWGHCSDCLAEPSKPKKSRVLPQ